MNANAKLYCNMIEMIEKKRNKILVIRKKEKNKSLRKLEDEYIKKYDELLLEKLRNLEKMLEEDQ